MFSDSWLPEGNERVLERSCSSISGPSSVEPPEPSAERWRDRRCFAVGGTTIYVVTPASARADERPHGTGVRMGRTPGRPSAGGETKSIFSAKP